MSEDNTYPEGTLAGFYPVNTEPPQTLEVGERKITSVIGHLLAPDSPSCPNCNASPNEHEVKNFNQVTRLGDVHCTKCGTYVRDYDPT